MSPEEKMQSIFSGKEEIESSLRSCLGVLALHHNRLETIAAQHRRRIPIRDLTFQEEFRLTIADLRAAVDKAQDFWKDARSFYNSCNKQEFAAENHMLIKQFRGFAVALSRMSDEVYTLYRNLSYIGKDIPLRLNWWLFDSSCSDLLKVSGGMLFLARDMEKF